MAFKYFAHKNLPHRWTCSFFHFYLCHLRCFLVIPLPPEAVIAEHAVGDVPERVHVAEGNNVEPHGVWNPLLWLLAHLASQKQRQRVLTPLHGLSTCTQTAHRKVMSQNPQGLSPV